MERLDGAWEPRGYLGPRLEIEGDRLTRLWRGGVVLTTRFTLTQEDGRTLLRLEEKALRYAGSPAPYAAVKECRLEGDAIVMVDEFPITGESSDTYYRTQNSRYGNVTIADDEVLPALAGTWRCRDMDLVLTFRGHTVRCGCGKQATWQTDVIAVRPNGGPAGVCYVVDRDPAKDGVGTFERLTYCGGTLRTCIPVCDARPVELVFEKE